jgi:hypothetical protein
MTEVMRDGSRILASEVQQIVRARQDHARNLVESDQDYRAVPSRLAHPRPAET